MAMFTILTDTEIRGRQITLEEHNLTIGVLKASISQHYAVEDQRNIVIHGVREEVPDYELLREHISGTEIRWSIKVDDAGVASQRSPEKDKLNIGRNFTIGKATQSNIIQRPPESDKRMEADITGNTAGGDSTQRNLIGHDIVITLEF
ncbi:hypothetical protein F5Y13DRAFT_164990 [Hypoxylon sp. FL1857]|nr:hypothetical protein F5Y13DRAFT_164990 [Hypoxylon sp. FL1857]